MPQAMPGPAGPHSAVACGTMIPTTQHARSSRRDTPSPRLTGTTGPGYRKLGGSTAARRSAEFECQVVHIADTGQRLIAYCTAPGSATAAAFRELASRAAQPAWSEPRIAQRLAGRAYHASFGIPKYGGSANGRADMARPRR